MRRLVLLLLLCFTPTLAHADCAGPITPVTAQEKAYYQARFPVLRAAIPQPPAGWKYADRSQDKLAPDYTRYIPTEDCGPSNYYIALGIEYQRPMSQAELEATVQAMRGPPDPDKQKQLADLQAKQVALIQQSVAASQKQDYAAVEALGKQGDALSKQMTALQADMNSGRQAKVDALQHDRSAKVDISINGAGGGITCFGSPKVINVPGAIAYQCEAPANYSAPGEVLDPASGHVVVVFGTATVKQSDWTRRDAQQKQIKDSYVDIKYEINADHALVVKNVVVDVSGDDLARVQSLFSQMDLRPLAALIKK